MTDAPGEAQHGSGMSLVRRYVHEAGGKIALASVAGPGNSLQSHAAGAGTGRGARPGRLSA